MHDAPSFAFEATTIHVDIIVALEAGYQYVQIERYYLIVIQAVQGLIHISSGNQSLIHAYVKSLGERLPNLSNVSFPQKRKKK